MSDGLPDMKVESVYQDNKGVLWIGTHDRGVVCFDGDSFNSFTRRDGLAGNGVYYIVEDDDGRMWFATDGGLCVYDGTIFDRLDVGADVAFLWGGLKGSDGCLWFSVAGRPGMPSAICKVKDGTPEIIYLSDSQDIYYGNDICEDEFGNIWCSGLGVYRISNSNIEIVSVIRDQINTIALIYDQKGVIWLSSNRGLYKYQIERETLQLIDDSLSGTRSIISIRKDRTGAIWFISQDGSIYQFIEGAIKEIAKTDNRFWHGAYFDGMDRLWIGSYGMGLHCYDFGRLHLLLGDGDDGPINKINCLVEDRDGVMWFGGDGGFIGKKDDSFEHYESDAEITALAIDRDNNLWAGTRTGGFFAFDGDCASEHRSVPQLRRVRVRALAEDGKGRIWFASLHGCSFGYYYEGELTYFPPSDSADYPSWIGALAIDKEGRVWLGSASPSHWDGLCCYEEGNFERISGIADYAILSLCLGHDGRIWIGTNEGVLCYRDGRTEIINQNNGLSYDIVTAIHEGKDGTLWFGTEGGGVCCYDGNMLQTIRVPGSAEYNVIHDIIEDRNGVLWFATQGGLVCYQRRSIAPKIQVVKVVADREYSLPIEVQCPISVGNVSFNFRGWSTHELSKYIKFRYRLEGFDDVWRQTDETSVNYTQLRTGEYTFKVQAVDRDLNYSEESFVKLTLIEDPRVEGLSEALRSASAHGEFVGESTTTRQVKRQIQEVAWSDLTVLVLGETGTGKGLAVRAIHELSARKDRVFIQVNCGSAQRELFDSELFGHEKGAFTGAIARKLGKFELADGGTIFLDEIGDLPLEAQTRLLHVLQEQNIERVGGTQPIDVDVRVIAATNRNLIEVVKKGRFRADLYYRLNVFPIEIPPLRERIEDIGLLAKYFVRRFAAHIHKQQPFIQKDSIDLLMSYDWPGNVRELEHIMQRAVILAGEEAIMPEHVLIGPSGPITSASPVPLAEIGDIIPLNEYERRYLIKVLECTQGVIHGKDGAAQRLGLKPTTLRSRLDKLGIKYRKLQLLN